MKRIRNLSGVFFALILFVPVLAFVNVKNAPSDKHLEVVLRNIGHQLLLHSNDSTSRVLPITTLNENIYQISFESSFGFIPDTLMFLVHRQLAKTNMPKDYIVTVKDCHEHQTVFAYEMNTLHGDLKPCGEREQEAGCYLVQIEFLDEKPFNYAWLLTGIIPLAFASFYLNRRPGKGEYKSPEVKGNLNISVSGNSKTISEIMDYQQFGEFRFYNAKGILCLHDHHIELSDKESKALNIFASNQNIVVERDRLMKEIWEEQGVIVINRNVDVLVSKLRKKLSGDPSVKIVNVHGKGYKLTC